MYYSVQRYCKSSEMQNKRRKIALFYKISPEKFVSSRKSSTFAPAKRNKGVLKVQIGIGVWCNGNTTDSGPVILGSSPSTPTKEIAKQLIIKRLAIFLWGRELVLSGYHDLFPIHHIDAGRKLIE